MFKKKIWVERIFRYQKISRLWGFFHYIYDSGPTFRQSFCRPAVHTLARIDDSHKVEQFPSRTNLFSSFPLVLCISEWNSQPESMATEQNELASKKDCDDMHLNSQSDLEL